MRKCAEKSNLIEKMSLFFNICSQSALLYSSHSPIHTVLLYLWGLVLGSVPCPKDFAMWVGGAGNWTTDSPGKWTTRSSSRVLWIEVRLGDSMLISSHAAFFFWIFFISLSLCCNLISSRVSVTRAWINFSSGFTLIFCSGSWETLGLNYASQWGKKINVYKC